MTLDNHRQSVEDYKEILEAIVAEREAVYQSALRARQKFEQENNVPRLLSPEVNFALKGELLAKAAEAKAQLDGAMEMIQAEGAGVLLYMRQEGRGIGLANKLKAYELQDKGLDTVEANEALGFKADLRDYGIGAQILVDLGIRKIRLLTNNPKKVVGLEGYGLEVIERIPLETKPTEFNKGYLAAKRHKLGHLFEEGKLG